MAAPSWINKLQSQYTAIMDTFMEINILINDHKYVIPNGFFQNNLITLSFFFFGNSIGSGAHLESIGSEKVCLICNLMTLWVSSLNLLKKLLCTVKLWVLKLAPIRNI